MKTVLINIPKRMDSYTKITQVELEVGKDVIIKETKDKLILNLAHEIFLYDMKEYQQTPEDYKMD